MVPGIASVVLVGALIAAGTGLGEAILAYLPGNPDGFSSLDSAPHVPRSLVISDGFDWGDDAPPAIPYSDTIIYETHVKGFTQLHPDVPAALRGTYAGLATKPAIDQLWHNLPSAPVTLPFRLRPATSRRRRRAGAGTRSSTAAPSVARASSAGR